MLRATFVLSMAASAAARTPFSGIGVRRRSVNVDAPSTSSSTPQPRVRRSALSGLTGGATVSKPPALLRMAYSACGLATSAAWTKVVFSAIRSNAPMGALMPSSTHGLFARTGALAVLPIIGSCYAVLADASKESWEQLGEIRNRRLNLALVASGVGSALWVANAALLTRIPTSSPLVSHVAFQGATRALLMGAYGAGAVLSAGVWARTLPEDVRSKPWTWPGRIADGVAQSLVSLAPKDTNDPVNVKYSLLAASFGIFTAIGFGPFPMAVLPSWTGRRCSRAFPAWMLLAGVSSLNLKEARESGKLLAEKTYRTLSYGLAGFGGTYLAARIGAVFIDPSFPVHYAVVTQVIGYQALAAIMIGLTLRPDRDLTKAD